MKLKKVAIVTGVRRGIGYGIIIALAKEGCNVVMSAILDRKTAKELPEK